MKRKLIVVGVFLGIIGIVALWQYISFRFKYAYSRGTRTGIVRKVSVKGPPYCKYLEGEMALQGNVVAMNQELWEFSVDDASEKNPVVQDIKKAEREGTRVTMTYRYDKSKEIWWRCNPSEYFVEKVDR
jgi:hypothetical protein